MAKKERQKRAARQARAPVRAEREAERRSLSGGDDKPSKRAGASASAQSPKKADKAVKAPKKKGRIGSYLSEVRAEMHRVVWPSRPELKNYSVAVIAMLIVFGIVIWLVDTGFVAALVGFTGLRG